MGSVYCIGIGVYCISRIGGLINLNNNIFTLSLGDDMKPLLLPGCNLYKYYYLFMKFPTKDKVCFPE